MAGFRGLAGRHAAAVLLALALGWTAAPASAQLAPAEDCGSAAWPLAAERARLGQSVMREVASGDRLALPIDDGVSLRLADGAAVPLPHPPSRGGAGPRAGFLRLAVPQPDRVWQITVAASAWIDVFVDGRALTPVAFTGLHACPGVRKSLRFRIPPGEAVLQFSGAEAERMPLIAARAPAP